MHGTKKQQRNAKIAEFFFVLFAIIFQMLMFYKRVRHISTTTKRFDFLTSFLCSTHFTTLSINQCMHIQNQVVGVAVKCDWTK